MSGETLIALDWLRLWCPQCGKYRRVTVHLDELQCDKCQWPTARLVEPRQRERL